ELDALRLEYDQLAGTEQTEHNLDRIASGGRGEHVGETMRRQRVEVVADGAEPANPHVRVGRSVLGADVRDVVRQIDEAEIELEAERLARAGRERRRDRREDRSLQPRGRAAAAVDGRLLIDRRRRVVVVEA